ncbi:efflux RND transporter periplasmic adaptor subunit [Candidatus Uabimicrobium sp. HlEnr_7]|uniref:efflux RND transporter periplasmic adaptor subunit n=1 Tax=Candidatus Uabimicrobium helgolandensis TaxID=3095367 RepID=UPI003558F606
MKTVVFCILFLVIACDSSTTPVAKKKTPASSPISLQEIIIKPRKIIKKYETTGELVSVNEVTLSSEINARIISRPVYVGDEVKKGQILFHLDSELLAIEEERLKQNILLEQARAFEAKNNLIRQQKLGTATTPQQRERASTNYTIIQQNLAILQQNLRKIKVNISKTIIRAPFSGEISKLFLNSNEFAQISHPLVTITDRSKLKVVTGIPEHIIVKLSKKNKVLIHVSSINKRYHSNIFCTYPSMNNNTKKIPIEVRIHNKNKLLFSGMFCRLSLTLAIKKGIIVPFEFIKVAYDMHFVKVADKKRFIEKRVSVALHKDGWLVTSGLKAGQKLQEY